MKWKTVDGLVVIEAYKCGCGGKPCIHMKCHCAMSTKEAVKVIEKLQKAVDYALSEGKT